MSFPTGHVSEPRRQQFILHQFDIDNPDLGSTSEACCPDLDATPASAWNLTFIDSVTTDFIASVDAGVYLDLDLPAEARVTKFVRKRVKTCLCSMIKKHRQHKRLNTLERLNRAKSVNKIMQRRRLVSCLAHFLFSQANHIFCLPRSTKPVLRLATNLTSITNTLRFSRQSDPRETQMKRRTQRLE